MAYNEELGYHDETQALIDRMCRIAEREDYVLNKKLAEEKLLATYALFGLEEPKNITWHVDLSSASSAWRASSASSASSALRALRALSASSALSALSALSASSASSAWRAWRASSALSASSIDYDFDYYTLTAQYKLNPTNGFPTEDDEKYIRYSELLLEAKEAGVGYWLQDGETLHLVPVPVTRFDQQARFHSETNPAVSWKGGEELYYLCGTEFDKDLWQKVTSGSLTAKDLAEIEDVDQRKIAMTFLTGEDFVRETGARLVDTGESIFYEHLLDRGIKKDGDRNNEGVLVTNRLYKIAAGDLYEEDKYFLMYENPSTAEMHISFVTNFVAKVGEKADECMARKHNCKSWKEFRAGEGA